MDLKINSQIPSNASSAPAGRPEGAALPVGPGGKYRLQSVGAIGADRIEISSLAERIADGLRTDSAQRSDRVRHFAALYCSGRYSPAPSDASRALISHALANQNLGKRMSTAAEIQQSIGEARSLVRAAGDAWAAGTFQRIGEAPTLLSSAVEIVRRANELLLSASPNVRRQAQTHAAALAYEVAELARLVDSSAAFYRGIAARVQGAGASYDSCGLATVLPESSGSPHIEV